MNKAWLLLISFFLNVCCAYAYAEFNINQLNLLSQSPNYLQGHFEQKKYLADFEIDLKSIGKFAYVRGESVHWQTLEPIQNVITMTPTSIVSHQGSEEVLNMQANDNPVVQMLSEVFFSVLTAQWQKLDTYFVITGDIKDGVWHVFMTPKDTALSQAIHKIELRGDDYLRYLKFFESNGDYTEINFTQLSVKK